MICQQKCGSDKFPTYKYFEQNGTSKHCVEACYGDNKYLVDNEECVPACPSGMYANHTKTEVDGKVVESYECVLKCASGFVHKDDEKSWSCWNHEGCQEPFPFLNVIEENGEEIKQCIDYCAGTKPYNYKSECYTSCPPHTNKYGKSEPTYWIKGTYNCLEECPDDKQYLRDGKYCEASCSKWWESVSNMTSDKL